MNRTIRYCLIVALLAAGGCLTGGCIYPQSAERAFGVANTPGISIEKTWFGAKATVANNTQGKGDLVYNPETKAFEVHFELNSNASDVYDAQGRRFTQIMADSRAAEIDAQRQIGMRAFDTMDNAIAMLGVVAPQAIPAYLQTMTTYAETLRGSGATVTIPGVGTGVVNIGTAAVESGATVKQGAVTTEVTPPVKPEVEP